MTILQVYLNLEKLAKQKYAGIVSSTKLLGGKTSQPNKLRIYFIDESFLDLWLSLEGDYSYHWERRLQTGKIYRWDNAPDHLELDSYPKHFHQGRDSTVLASRLPTKHEKALTEIMDFISLKLGGSQPK